MQQTKYRILIMGASYGSLLGVKLLLAGHAVKLVCLPAEADLINSEGFRVRLPIKASDELVEIDTRRLPGKVSASGAAGVDPSDYDLVTLAMQEPQYASPGVRALLYATATAKVPCMSIMNMPPLPYLARIPGLDVTSLRNCYTDASVWDAFDPNHRVAGSPQDANRLPEGGAAAQPRAWGNLMTLCSPDPQAFRPPDEKVNVLQVSLPTNFKAARFASDAHTAILRRLESDIESIRFETSRGPVELPVKLKVHDSVFVPLAKWSMLLTGNYRCVRRDAMRSIRDAVHSDIDASREVYAWVGEVCKALGASDGDLVPFEKYANAALGLTKPSSAARALAAGAANIERVDRLVQTVAAQKGMRLAAVDRIVALVDGWLARNRKPQSVATAT